MKHIIEGLLLKRFYILLIAICFCFATGCQVQGKKPNLANSEISSLASEIKLSSKQSIQASSQISKSPTQLSDSETIHIINSSKTSANSSSKNIVSSKPSLVSGAKDSGTMSSNSVVALDEQSALDICKNYLAGQFGQDYVDTKNYKVTFDQNSNEWCVYYSPKSERMAGGDETVYIKNNSSEIVSTTLGK